METSNPSSERQNVSFKFTKKLSKALSGNKLEEPLNKNTEKDFVFSVIDRDIKSTAPKVAEKDLVIPIIKENCWRFPDGGSEKAEDSETRLQQMAVEELIKESKERNEEWSGMDESNTMGIPLMMQNKVPEGYETDGKMDVSLRPEESTLDDYEKFPVDKFGLALLRGMGWKDGEAIGSSNKGVSEPIEVNLRPKGLGLGADISALNKLKEKNNKDDEELQLKKGSYIQILKGAYEGFYGQVLGLDEENARVVVKITGKDNTISCSEICVQVVSKKEFEKESKVLNRESYEKYKKAHLENGKSDESRERSRREKESPKERSSEDNRKRSYDSSRSRTQRESDKREHKSKRSKSSERNLGTVENEVLEFKMMFQPLIPCRM